MRVTPDGVVSGVLPGTAARVLAVWLDRRFCGTLLAEPAGLGILRFAWRLPAHLLAARFGLTAAEGGAELAGLDLAAHYALAWGGVSAGGGALSVWFVCGGAVAEHVELVLHDGDGVFAAGLARRGADGRHRLACPAARLLPLGDTAWLVPSIGGLALPGFALAAAQLGLVGGVEATAEGDVAGWIASAGAAPEVALLQDGVVLATARPRLNAADPADRRGLFRLRRPPGVAGQVRVVLAGTPTELPGSPLGLAPPLQGRLERLSRHAAHGWARDPDQPERRLLLEAVVDGVVLARVEADQFRGDVAEAGHGDGQCGFRLDLSAHAHALAGRTLSVRLAGDSRLLEGTPAVIGPNPALARFLARDRVAPPRLSRMMDHRTAPGGVSVLLGPGQAGAAVLDALRGQWCGRWEAICLGAGAADPDPRIRWHRTRQGGLAAARFDRVLLLTVPARLEPDAIYHLLRAGPGLLFWDEAVTDRGVTDAVHRGAFSPDHFAGWPDLGTGFCLPTSVARAVGWGVGMADVLSRALPLVGRVGHIPRILAQVDASEGGTLLGAPVRVEAPAAEGEVLIVIPTHNALDVLRRCLDSIRATAGEVAHRILVIDHRSDDPATRRYLARLGGRATVMRYEGDFNYAAMNNQAVARHGDGARFVLFLNNDTEALHPGWLDRLRRLAARPEVGAVGNLLLYPDRRVQHAGVVLGVGGVAGHAFAFDAAYRDGRRLPGPQGMLTALRDVAAVTAACMMLRREAFDAVGGFDERFAVGFNDTDLCLRLRLRGLRILYDGSTILLHHESRTRRQTGQLLHRADTQRFRRRWAALLREGDPWYHPQLNLIAADWAPRMECAPPAPPRFTAALSAPGAAPAAAPTPRSAAPPRRRSSG